MSTRTFTDAQLHEAAVAVLKSMLDSFPATCDHEFSERHKAKMASLLRRVKAHRNLVFLSKRIAAVFAAMLIGVSSWLALDSNARAVFFEWVREVYENSIVYRYFGPKEPEALPEYELGWLPDGMVEMLNESDLMGAIQYYVNPDTGETIILEYRYLNEKSQIEVSEINASISNEVVVVNGFVGEYYPATLNSTTNNLIWTDTSKNILFVLNSNLDKNTIISVAEKIKLVDSTKS